MSVDRPHSGFALQGVQQLHRAQRDRCQQSLAAVRAAEAAEQTALAELQAQLAQLRSGLRAALIPGEMVMDDLRAMNTRERALRQEIAACEARRAELAGRGEQSRAALAAADREVRLLDRLAERQHQHQQRQNLRQEAGELDDRANCAARGK